ncbi:MAG TPA: CAP domain-containing protein [Telluria sp.]
MHSIRPLAFIALLSTIVPATAAPEPALAGLVNAYRSAPVGCRGRPAPAAPRLLAEPALSRVRIGPGTILVAVLDAAGYEAEQVDAIQVSGPADAQGAFDALLASHCATLLSGAYSAIGTSRSGNTWTVVLARPMPDLAALLPEWEEAGRAVLAATNAARAVPRLCGDAQFGPAPPVAWNAALAQAARTHSVDMASHRAFGHRGSDHSEVGARARREGYGWRGIGENISFGQRAAEEAVEGWISSPGHCANLMNPAMTEMGAAYALRPPPRQAAYWTQVFGRR